MIEVHLIGYTEDGEQLVFDLEADGEGRYALTVDPDLLATVAALRAARVAHGAPVDEVAVAPPREQPATAGGGGTDAPDPVAAGPDADGDGVADAAGAPGTDTGAADPADPTGPADDAGTAGAPRSALRPAEIQRLLRSGRSVAAVAAEAGVDAAWIERWSPPILAERQRVLEDAWSRPVGDAGQPLRTTVDAALAGRGIAPERIVWSAARRADGRWRVSVRFPEDGRSRSATWTMRAEGGPLSAASPLATELLAAPRAGRRR